MADAVGAVSTALDPASALVEAHVHGRRAPARRRPDRAGAGRRQDQNTGHLWIYVRDDEPFGRPSASRDLPLLARPHRRASAGASHWLRRHRFRPTPTTATTSSISRICKPSPIREAAYWACAAQVASGSPTSRKNTRRKAGGKSEIPLSPIAIEVVRRIDALFEIEREINGKSAEERLAVRRAESRTLVDDLVAYMREQTDEDRPRGHDLVKAIQYMACSSWHLI